MGPPSVPAGEPSSRHEKVAAFVSRSSAEPKPADYGDLDAFRSEEPKRPEPPAPAVETPREPRRLRMVGGIAAAALGAGAAVVLGASAAVWFAPSLMGQFPAIGANRPGRVTIG